MHILLKRCHEEGIVFISILLKQSRSWVTKYLPRKAVEAFGVPVVPGTAKIHVTTEQEAIEWIERIGLPVMIKASAGGGGKGMRLVKKSLKSNHHFVQLNLRR